MSAAFDRLITGYYNNNLLSVTNPGGLAGTGAVRKNFFSGLVLDFITVAGEAAASALAAGLSATNAAASAQSALNAPGTNGTSATNMTISAAGTVLNPVLSTGKSWVSGMNIVLSSTASPANRMLCRLDAYTSGSGASTVTVMSSEGAGTFASWNVSLSGIPLNTTTDTLNVTKDMKLTGVIAPAALAADQNDWAPAGLAAASVVKVAATGADRTITGLAGGAEGKFLVLENVGAFALVLAPNSASSAAANRFDLGTSFVLRPKRGAILIYDAAASLWRVFGTGSAQASDIRAGSSAEVAATPAALFGSAGFITLTDAATVAWDAATGFNGKVTLGGNRTIGAPTNLQDGVCYCLMVSMNATGGWAPSWNAIWDFGIAGTPSFPTAANKMVGIVLAIYDGAGAKLRASAWVAA